MTLDFDFPPPYEELFRPHRYKVFYGGRGSAKSWSVARALLLQSIQKSITVLCAREIQNSISDSVHRLLREQIDQLGLDGFFEITKNTIYRKPIKGDAGSEFIFKGLRFNSREIKSTEGVNICWCFPAGTKIDGRNIEDIKEGEYVLSYNHASRTFEYKKVLKAFKNAYSEPLYKLTYAGTNSIIATGEHPFYVKGKGYVALKNIQKGDVIYEEKVDLSCRGSLFGWLWRNDSNRHGRPESKIPQKWWSLLCRLRTENVIRENEKEQPDEQRRKQSKNVADFENKRLQADSFGRKWTRLYKRSEIAMAKTWTRLVGGIYCPDWSLQRWERFTNTLQDRLSKLLLWYSHRDRRGKSYGSNSEGRGLKKRYFLAEQRVESVEVQKQGSFGRCGQGNEQNYVYNIEVEGNNNYFANGILVHNCEEAQAISDESWEILVPTIREPNSEIWITFNPLDESDPTYQRFVLNPPDNAYVRKVNYDENPYFPKVLRDEMEWLKDRDYQSYLHIWEGEVRKHSNSLVFGGYFKVEDFETPRDARFYHGIDFGFANDPSTLVRCFIKDKTLYIDQEAWGFGVEIDELPQLFDSIETARKWPLYADCSRPETISYVRRQGFNIKPCKKWQGSIEDGIEFLKTFDIVIHPRCKHIIDEFNHYSYKVDKQTNDVLPVIVDSFNHGIDALRYSLDGLIKGRGSMNISMDALRRNIRR